MSRQRNALTEAGCEKILRINPAASRPHARGRSLRQLTKAVQMLQDKGIELRSLHESIDTATGKLLFHLVAAFAQFERGNMIENTKVGLEAARARGKKGGRKPATDA